MNGDGSGGVPPVLGDEVKTRLRGAEPWADTGGTPMPPSWDFDGAASSRHREKS